MIDQRNETAIFQSSNFPIFQFNFLRYKTKAFKLALSN